MTRFSMSIEEREQLFHTELVKAGVAFRSAAKAARLLAIQSLDEPLTQEETKLIQDVCTQWLAQRKRMTLIDRALHKGSGRRPLQH